MTRASLTLLVLFLGISANAFADTATPDFLFEFGYTGASISPSALNSARQAFYWNGTTPGQGSFNDLSGFGGSIGYQFFDGVYFLLQIKQLTQALGSTSVSGTSYSETESFEYDPIILLADIPFHAYDWLTLSLRGGLDTPTGSSYANKTTAETTSLFVWGANPIPLQIGGTANFSLLDYVGLLFGRPL